MMPEMDDRDKVEVIRKLYREILTLSLSGPDSFELTAIKELVRQTELLAEYWFDR